MCIRDSIYLKAAWAEPFDSALSTSAPFHSATGSVLVPTMHSTGELEYGSGPNWEAVELPYAGGSLVMRILLPSRGQAVQQMLSPAILRAAAHLRPAQVDLALPRWDFATNLDLTAALEQLGMRTAFSGAADFTRIAPGLFVNSAIHRANITVDEKGTTAAAVTAFGLATGAQVLPHVVLHLDRPFAFEVLHLDTGIPLFVGSVDQPTRHQ